ncbi:hypothetical protein HNQ36_001084 [Afipia massiliensis]|uniref:Uncharacterized protein n=1 Tax=Afipia massiliensis TaxID=211460 RepID=A0A840MWK0_9BRAD|nr:hypothetical protein [Afipia massiliensis]MBB5051130.1 hypothetical protein [Afipia massiliensis]
MAVIYAAGLRTSRMQAVLDAINAGSGPGFIEIGTTAMALVLATIPLEDPAGSVSGDVLTFDFSPPVQDTAADASGTAAAARIKDSAGNIVVSGLTVGTSGSNINLDSVSITAGQTVQLTSGTLTHNTSGV